ncbi:TlpA disulfide reductase family protein [Solitalea lacus]|uniref:TlpA disulfide reductase family protein n=1 Tax=Solitalea lacus TaxID=2911172 RepID=UPI001EDC1EB7|nr:TlpA disulfide reductase family protein [Solitalea lacus]UKJ06564.1 AhpC/TSA family protein [Solitalea lacus]
MFKKILFQCIAILLTAVSSYGQFAGSFQIKGSVSGIADVDKIVLRYRTANGLKSDTVKPIEGKYSFAGQITEPQLTWINILHAPNEYGRVKYPKKGEMTELYINPGEIVLQSIGQFANMQASGSGAKWQKDYVYLAKQQQLTKDSGQTMVHDYREASLRLQAKPQPVGYTAADREKDSIQVKKIDNEYILLSKHLNENILIPYIRKNPGSPLSLWVLKIYAGDRVDDYQTVKALYESLSNDVKQMPLAKPFTRLLDIASKTASDVVAPVFSLPDTTNTMVSLESFRGKYVLVDFWASWCGPCRAENPHVRKLYEQYKDKGFTILSVSIDSKSQVKAWKKAIVDDKLSWPQVVTTDGAVANLYHVNSVPQNFLINPEGKIIAKNLPRQELAAKLKELFAR